MKIFKRVFIITFIIALITLNTYAGIFQIYIDESKIEIIPDNNCIYAGVYLYPPTFDIYSLKVSSKCKDKYMYVYPNKNEKILVSRSAYDNTKKGIREENNIYITIHDSTIHGEVGEFTRKMVNPEDPNDIILIKGDINRDFKTEFNILYGKTNIIVIYGIIASIVILLIIITIVLVMKTLSYYERKTIKNSIFKKKK